MRIVPGSLLLTSLVVAICPQCCGITVQVSILTLPHQLLPCSVLLCYRRPDKTEVEEPTTACPYCAYQLQTMRLDCPECKNALPYCIVSVRAINCRQAFFQHRHVACFMSRVALVVLNASLHVQEDYEEVILDVYSIQLAHFACAYINAFEQGCHMVRDDWTMCPSCKFPALFTHLSE